MSVRSVVAAASVMRSNVRWPTSAGLLTYSEQTFLTHSAEAAAKNNATHTFCARKKRKSIIMMNRLLIEFDSIEHYLAVASLVANTLFSMRAVTHNKKSEATHKRDDAMMSLFVHTQSPARDSGESHCFFLFGGIFCSKSWWIRCVSLSGSTIPQILIRAPRYNVLIVKCDVQPKWSCGSRSCSIHIANKPLVNRQNVSDMENHSRLRLFLSMWPVR